jgi:hypothetical protein
MLAAGSTTADKDADCTYRPHPWTSSREGSTMTPDQTNGPGAADTARGPAIRTRVPMTHSSYGAQSRRPVYSGTRRVPGLYQRTRADGSTVYDAALRLGGKVRRHRLEAQTKTDAINELRNLQTDYARGEAHRSPAAAVTVAELLDEFTLHMHSRIGDPDPKRRRSRRTADHYD